jgi:cytochrome c5
MTMRQKHLLACALALGAISVSSLVTLQAQPQDAAQSNTISKKHVATTHDSKQPQEDGARIFEQNCSRCHTAPSGFSPRISGTILRHMRVRAALSQNDEQALLHFFNP